MFRDYDDRYDDVETDDVDVDIDIPEVDDSEEFDLRSYERMIDSDEVSFS